MAFWQLILMEGLLLIAAGMTVVAGMRGIIGSGLLLSILTGFLQPEFFWNWVIPLWAGVGGALVVLFYLNSKAREYELLPNLAGGITSLVVLGAFLTPLIALTCAALLVGTGIVPKLQRKHVLWSLAPILWRTCLGITWVVGGNILF